MQGLIRTRDQVTPSFCGRDVSSTESRRFGNAGRAASMGANNEFCSSSPLKEDYFLERMRFCAGIQNQARFNWLSLGSPRSNITTPNGMRSTGPAKGTTAGRVPEFARGVSS